MRQPHFTLLTREWAPAPFDTTRLGSVLADWEDTPYHDAMCEKGRGVSCVGFLARTLDELFRRPEPTPFPSLPRDTAMHNKEGSHRALRYFLEQFPHERVNDGDPLQPGDVLAVGAAGPGHAMIVGPRKNTLWQSGSCGVHMTGWALPNGYHLFAAFRLTDRETWI